MEPIAPLSWEDLPAEVLEIVFSKIRGQAQLGPLRLVNSSWRNALNRSLKFLRLNRRRCGGDIESLGRTFTRLETLSIFAKDEDMVHKLSSIKGLKKLILVRFPCARLNGLELLTNLSRLRIVSLSDELKPNFLEMLCTLRNLKHLDISLLRSWNSDSSIEQLSSMTNLTGLRLHSFEITSTEFLSGLTNLEALVLTCSLRRCNPNITPLSSLVNLTNNVLKIGNLATLTGLSKLTHLDLSRNSNDVTDEEVLFLTGMVSLKKLILDETGAKTAIQILAPLTGLEELHLNQTPTKETDLVELSNLVGLKEVSVRKCKIEREELKRVSAALPHIRFR